MTKELTMRYEALEELINIRETFGFSTKNMKVVELLTHNGFEYTFFFLHRPSPFITIVYDLYLEKVTKVDISCDFGNLYEEKERLENILSGLTHRITEKHARRISQKVDVNGEVINKTNELMNFAYEMRKELLLAEKKDTILKSLEKVARELKKIEEEIENQKESVLDKTLEEIVG